MQVFMVFLGLIVNGSSQHPTSVFPEAVFPVYPRLTKQTPDFAGQVPCTAFSAEMARGKKPAPERHRYSHHQLPNDSSNL